MTPSPEDRPPRWLTLLLSLAAGLLLYLAFPGTGWWPLGLLAVVGFYLATLRDHAGWNFLVVTLGSLAFALPHVRWAYYATETLPWIALGLLVAVGIGMFGPLWTWARRLPWVATRPWARVLAFATCWVAVEQWRSEVPFGGFPWGRLAWSVSSAPTGRAAWLGGTPLVSWLLAAAALLALLAACNLWRWLAEREGATVDLGRRAAGVLGPALLAGVALLAPLALPLPSAGVAAVASPSSALAPISEPNGRLVDAGSSAAEAGTLLAGLVQGDVPGPEVETGRSTQVLHNHLAGTHALAELGLPLDVVLWPENSADFDPATSPVVAEWLDAAAAEVGAPILVGAMEWPDYGGRYNVALLWREGAVISRYAKQHPAPFGEYIPLRSLVRLLSDQVDRVQNDMWAATNPPLIDLPAQHLGRHVYLGVGICFEVAYDRILREAARLGAEVLVVPTNNASFGHTSQSTQQLQMTQLQAIANGRATIQISTNGVSAVIAPDGTIVARTGLWESAQLVAELPLRTTLTPATVLGYWPGWLLSAAGGALGVAGLTRRWWSGRRPGEQAAGSGAADLAGGEQL
ncbi:MAG: apolipoprotein N-acyltransferase [Promicromonosporaceae bacterium]|nr:apolipoprotein N-acyltransferase [Promicromonosporaceae bacterium]